MKAQLDHINRNFHHYRNLLYALVVVALLFIFFVKSREWCIYRGFFALDTTEIKGNNLVDPNHIITTGNIHKDMNVLTTDCSAIRNNLETHPYVKAAIVSKRYPNKMEIIIKERIPIAYLNTGKLLLIDGEGIVLPIPDTIIGNQLPVITIAPDSAYMVIPGEKLQSPEINKITNFVINTYSYSRSLYSTISEIRYNLYTRELVLFNKDNGNPVYFGTNDFDKKMRTLAKFQRLLTGKKRLRDYRYIDLRWEQQIVVKEL